MMVVMCEAGLQRIACTIPDVVEVVGRPRIHPVGAMPAWVDGVFTYRGRLIPSINLSLLLGGAAAEPKWSSRLIVVQIGTETQVSLVGLAVDRVRIETLADSLRAALERTSIRGPLGKVAPDADGLVCLLSPEMLNQQLEPVLAAVQCDAK